MTYADDHAANPCNRCQSPPGVRCEHDEPTPTPAPGLDLDAVERAERAMTPGPWRHGSVERHHVFCSEGDRSLLCPEAGRVLLRMNEHFPHDSDAAGIVTLRNAATALIAEVRALRAQVCRLVSGQAIESDALCQHHDADLAALAERDEARAEIARLTAELAAARAVPADVEAAIDAIECRGCGHGDPVTNADADRLKAAIARAISDATAARGTVGGLLATAPVGSIVEYMDADGSAWHQVEFNATMTAHRLRIASWGSWKQRDMPQRELRQPARLVPADQADLDPATRGPLPKGG